MRLNQEPDPLKAISPQKPNLSTDDGLVDLLYTCGLMKKRTVPKKAVKSAGRKSSGIPSHVHPYGANVHRDLDWHEKKFQKLTGRLPADGQKTVQRALDYSRDRHGSQQRYGGSPYIIHPLRISNILMSEWGVLNAAVIAAALLHDVVEDTQTTIKEIKDTFGDEIGKLVDGMTMWKGSETYELYCKRVARGPQNLRIIKCADVLDNLRSWHEVGETPDAMTRWWREVNGCVLPIADATEPQAAASIRALLEDRWYLKMAQMQ